MRDETPFDLEVAVRTMCAGIREPVVSLSLSPALHSLDAERAQVVFRCIQEGLTNTLRHAAAKHLWIDVEGAPPQGWTVTIRDDGVGAPSAAGSGSGRLARATRRSGRCAGGGRARGCRRFAPRDDPVGDGVVIRVVLADDQTLVRQGIRGLLELTPDIRVAGEASTGKQAVEVVLRLRPDVALFDVRMPGTDGIEALRLCQRAGFAPPTLLLTTFDDDQAMRDGLAAGIAGYLLKDVESDQLAEAVRTVAAGGSFIEAVAVRAREALREGTGLGFDSLEGASDSLTAREVEVLRLMAAGLSNREIAGTLGVTEGTVKNHASSILSKLGVRDRTRAVLKWLERSKA